MPKRRNLDREGLEVHLLNLLLGYRPFLLLGGLMFLVFALVTVSSSMVTGAFSIVVSAYLIILTANHQTAVFTSKALAWAGTFWKSDQ